MGGARCVFYVHVRRRAVAHALDQPIVHDEVHAAVPAKRPGLRRVRHNPEPCICSGPKRWHVGGLDRVASSL